MNVRKQCRVFCVLAIAIVFMMAGVSCDSSGGSDSGDLPGGDLPGGTIAGASVALDSVLRTIPDSVLATIRSDFEVAYFHTSHGTHVSYGVFGLPDFKDGDDVKFAVSTTKETGKLYFRDNPGGFSRPDMPTGTVMWVREGRKTRPRSSPNSVAQTGTTALITIQ